MLLLRHGIPRPDPKPSSVGTFRPGRRPRSAMFRTGCPAATAHRPRPATCKRLRARAGTDRFDRTDATVTKRVVVVPILNNTTYIFIWYIPYIYTPYTYTVHKWNTHTHEHATTKRVFSLSPCTPSSTPAQTKFLSYSTLYIYTAHDYNIVRLFPNEILIQRVMRPTT